jgi:hypothetical protein
VRATHGGVSGTKDLLLEAAPLGTKINVPDPGIRFADYFHQSRTVESGKKQASFMAPYRLCLQTGAARPHG